jgi:hypothetical protein
VDGADQWATTSASFTGLIVKLSGIMRGLLLDVSTTRLIFRRTDREGLADYVASTEELKRILEHPIDFATRADGMSRTVVVRDTPPEVRAVVRVRAGYDTLADSFGDNVYVRHRADDGKIECPCCGRWMAELDATETLRCRCTGRIVPAKICGSWVEICTVDLTEHPNVQRFYLPRAWNISGPWIKKDDLTKKLATYLQEVSNA